MGKHALDGLKIEVKRADFFYIDPKNVKIIGVDVPKDDPVVGHLRDYRAEKPLLESHILDYMVRGIIQPVRIKRVDDSVYIVVGRRRTLGLREANKRLKKAGKEPHLLPCVIWRGDEAIDVLAMLAENEHREEDDTLSKAEKAANALNFGSTKQQVAVACGISIDTLDGWLKLLEADPKVKNAVRTGKLPETAGVLIARLPRAEQLAELEKILAKIEAGEKVTVEQVKAEVRAAKAVKANPGAERGEARVAPNRTQLKKVLDAFDNGFVKLSDETLYVLRWVVGDQEATKELKKALAKVEDLEQKRQEERAAKAAEKAAKKAEEAAPEAKAAE